MAETTTTEIIEIVKIMKNKTSSGHDNISIKLMKQIINQIVEPLMHIINGSLNLGIVPAEMKIAKVIPVHKSEDPSSFDNYRPISVLPSFSKILDKI
jgi:hypothetical protein